jgi:hypothetical protein
MRISRGVSTEATVTLASFATTCVVIFAPWRPASNSVFPIPRPILEPVHAGVGEEERGVAVGNERTAAHAAGLKFTIRPCVSLMPPLFCEGGVLRRICSGCATIHNIKVVL